MWVVLKLLGPKSAAATRVAVGEKAKGLKLAFLASYLLLMFLTWFGRGVSDRLRAAMLLGYIMVIVGCLVDMEE
jgi:hypothetical protein